MSIRSCNDKFKSEFAKLTVKADRAIKVSLKSDHGPRLAEARSDSLRFDLADLALDPWHNASEMVVLVQDYDREVGLEKNSDLLKFVLGFENYIDNDSCLCHDFGDGWIALITMVRTTLALPLISQIWNLGFGVLAKPIRDGSCYGGRQLESVVQRFVGRHKQAPESRHRVLRQFSFHSRLEVLQVGRTLPRKASANEGTSWHR